MAAKLRINYAKSTSSTSLLVKVRIKNDITPDRWVDFVPIVGFESLVVWYRAAEDPTTESHTQVSAYKTKTSESGKWTWKYYKLTGLSAGIKYHIEATGLGVSGVQYYSKVTIESPSVANDGTMFCIENENYEWEDFTNCIPVPDYRVNVQNITEEWEDANYNNHSSVVQTKVKGTLSLRFPDRTRLNRFLKCIDHNDEQYGKGHVRCKVQVNNEMDFEAYETVAQALPNIYIEFFKMEWDPDWSLPFYGTSKDYSAVSINIEEIED